MHRISIIIVALTLLLACQTDGPVKKHEQEKTVLPTGRVQGVEKPAAEGDLPTAEGDLPTAEGVLPAAEGVLPVAEGSLPTAELPTPLPAFALFPQAGPLYTVSELRVEEILNRLTVRQKIGQRFICSIPGTEITDKVIDLICNGYIGGIILTSQNISSIKQVKMLTSSLQETARVNEIPIELFIGIDQESGRVNRLKLDHITRFPPPFFWGRYEDPYFIEAIAYITSRELLELGCNMNFAPVLDLYNIPDDSIIGDRSMGNDPIKVGKQGIYYIHGAHRAGITPVVKHFPGHGATTIDSHFYLPVIDKDEETLLKEDLFPFRMAIEYDVQAVMTAHILYPGLDAEFPVTLSEKIINGLLRGKMGYKGVIITDDIGMKALSESFSFREILKYSFKAGVDILLELDAIDTLELIEIAFDLYKSEEISAEDIDVGVKRVLGLKMRNGLIKSVIQPVK